MKEKIHIEQINSKQYLYHLDNGLRVIYTFNPSTLLVHCGYLIRAGSRNETKDNNGMAHFIEHTAFKGTKRRKARQILDYIETVGGELNAYTTRERTFFYASVLNKYADRAVDLLTDIVFYPVFPHKEIEKEKSVINEEIDMYLDSPEESIYDEFNSNIFVGDSLGLPTLGTKKSLKNINRKKIDNFRAENYSSDKIVFSVVGNIKTSQMERIIERFLLVLPGSKGKKNSFQPIQSEPFEKEIKKKFQQVHCVIGNLGYSALDDRKYRLMLLNNILGGDWMSSRLNLVLREKHAFVYNISSNYNVYSDIGLFIIQFGTDKKHLDKCIKLINNELDKLLNNRISVNQLEKAKRQIYGQYAMLEESNGYIMQSQARNIVDFNRILSREEFFDHVDSLTPEMLLQTAGEIFDFKRLSKLIYVNK